MPPRHTPRAVLRWLVFSAWLIVLAGAPEAFAQRIILVCPPEADTLLTEAFNRLRGELTMHGFNVEIQTASETISPQDLAVRAESMAAVASVSFVRNAGYTTADITISDRVTGKTSIRTIATPAGSEAASLLALRAVELLRTSLREYWEKGSVPSDVVGASPDRASPTVEKWVKPAPSPSVVPAPTPAPPPTPVESPKRRIRLPPLRRFSLRADLLGAVMLPNVHGAYGFGGALTDRIMPNIEARLAVEVPWFGLQYSTSNARSQVHLFTVAAEMTYTLASSRRLELQLIGGVGLVRLTMFTTTNEPWLPMLPAAWLLMPRAGLGLSVALSYSTYWHTGAHLAVLAPPTRLHLEDREFTLGQPMLLFSSGVGVRF